MVALKRAYQPGARGDGARILVERLWPRGVKKTDLALDAWLKEVAPTTELRKWFSHDPAKWAEFQRRYRAELESRPEAAPGLEHLLTAARRGHLTLIYSSHDADHNNAVVLKYYLDAHLRKQAKHAS